MPHHIPTLPADSKFGYHSYATPSFICFIALTISLFGFACTSLAAPASSAQENQSNVAENNTLVNTPSAAGWVKGHLLIMPRAGLPPQALENLLKPHGAKSKQLLEQINVHIIELPAGVDEVKVMHALEKSPKLKFVELDMVAQPSLSVTDPSFGNNWALPKIQTPAAWDIANGDGIIIAILDTGVDGTHPDLAANMVPGWNFYDNNADTSDVNGHGTAITGVALASANNGIGSAGISWMSSIMPIRIASPSASASMSTIAQGVVWAADNGAKVANISYSVVAGSSTVQSAAKYLRSKGGVVVVAAANTGGKLNYAASDSLLAVAATDSNDRRASWSSYGPYVDLAAPGVGVYTTLRGGGYGNVSGTSISSPIVAATAALMLSANNNLSPADLDQILLSTTIDLGTQGYDEFYGEGRVDAAAAVAAAATNISVDNQAPTIAISSPTSGEVSGIVLIDVNYSDNVGVTKVELYVNGQKIITDTQSPFAFSWDSTAVADGDYTLKAHAFDAAGNQGTSTNVSVTVKNSPATDSEAPIIAVTSPTGGKVSGTIPVRVNYSDNVSVVGVELHVNGQKTLTDSQAPFEFSLDTTTLADGTYTLTAIAFDEAGNRGTSSNVSVNISNVSIEDTTSPIITSFNLSDGMTVSRKQTISVSATDDQSVAQITLTIDGDIVASGSNSLSYNWNTNSKQGQKNITYSITVLVTDDSGNTTRKTVSVHT